MEREQMRTWAEIRLDNLEHNYRALRGGLEPGCRFVGVVKADAYGHGAVPVARKLEELGADYLAVACLEEALELRRAGIRMPVLILGVTPPEFADELVKWNITQAVSDLELARAISDAAGKAGVTARIHLKVDTGMGRLGVVAGEDPEQAAAALAPLCELPGVEAEGIFTHFAKADSDEDYTMGQFTRFLDVVDRLEKILGRRFQIRHCAASAAVLNYPCTHLDMVRPGIALYGHYPDPSCEGLDGPGLLPVMTLKSRIVSVKELPAGASISYGGIHILERDSRIAVLPIGYADGLHRLLSNRMEVLLHGRRVRQVGRICMDLCMVDVTDLPEVRVGDVATLFGPELPLEEKADTLGTIQYELLCSVSRRVPRIY